MKRLLRRGAFQLKDVTTIMLTLIFIAVFGVATYLVLAGLQTSVSDGNATNNLPAESAITNMTLTMDNVIGYAPTWGTIIGVAVLIGIVVAAFSFARSRGGGDRAL